MWFSHKFLSRTQISTVAIQASTTKNYKCRLSAWRWTLNTKWMFQDVSILRSQVICFVIYCDGPASETFRTAYSIYNLKLDIPWIGITFKLQLADIFIILCSHITHSWKSRLPSLRKNWVFIESKKDSLVILTRRENIRLGAQRDSHYTLLCLPWM